MSIKHTKINGGMFSFKGLTDNTVAPISPKSKKKKEKIPFYTKIEETTTVVDIGNTPTTNTVGESIFKKNEIIYDDDTDLELPEDAQVVQPEQSPEGSYESIWKKPRIRPNVDFEDEEVELDEEIDFEDEVSNFPAITAKQKNNLETVLQRLSVPKTQPSSVPEEPIEEVEEESVGEKIYVTGTGGEYVGVFNELQDTIGKMKKDPLFGNIDLQSTSLSLKEGTTIHKYVECTPDSNLVPKQAKLGEDLATNTKKK